MKREIIETAVSISTGLISKCRSSDNQEDKTINAPEYSGLYIHNVSGSMNDKWLPAVAVCDHFGITLKDLQLQLVKCGDGSSVTDPEGLREFTPISIQQIRKLAAVLEHKESKGK